MKGYIVVAHHQSGRKFYMGHRRRQGTGNEIPWDIREEANPRVFGTKASAKLSTGYQFHWPMVTKEIVPVCICEEPYTE